MLLELRLRGLGAIDEAVLELSEGFTALTGETGAGKTMVLTGLALLLGGRADAALVRDGYDRAQIDGRFRVDPQGPAAAAALEVGAELEDGVELIISRTVAADGRSRGWLGGRPVPLSVLAGLADDLVTVHGQSDQRGLLRRGVQRAVLDAYGGPELAAALRGYRDVFDRLGRVRTSLAESTAAGQAREADRAQLQAGLADIDAVAPVAGEDEALRDEAQRLGHVDALRHAVVEARQALDTPEGSADSGEDAVSRVAQARRSLDVVTGRDRRLDELAQRLAALSYQLGDLLGELASYAAGLADDPHRLAVVQDRQARLAPLLRRHDGDLAAVLGWAEQARERLDSLEAAESALPALRTELAALTAELTTAAIGLSGLRTTAAQRLAGAVAGELAALAMPQARLAAAVTQHDDEHGLATAQGPVAFGPWGIDEVELTLAPHSGAPSRPLHRGASGGELSRVMLALEIVLAAAHPVATYVFDEVDAGVGGRAAVEIGHRLARLAAGAQVLVVTHLPQVAAFADHHLVVSKDDDGRTTSASVVQVEGDQRLREVSRMLAGLADSEHARGHAQELLDAAVRAAAGDAGQHPGAGHD